MISPLRHPRRDGRRRSGRAAERGFILVIGLLFMLVLLLLATAMFRSFTMQESIAGNTREKERSFEVAQSALQFGENWVSTNGGTTGAVACSGTLSAITVCSNAIPNPTGPASGWPGYYTYQRSDMSVNASGGLNTGGTDVNYQAAPQIYVNYLNLSADGQSVLYQVTAAGYGGNAETTSVVQSTYQLKSATTSVMGP